MREPTKDQAYWSEKHKDPAFLKVRDEWRDKLKAEGFEDLEMIDALTKEPSTHMLKGMSPGDLWRGLYKPDAEEYYTQCRAHVHAIRSNPVLKAVWSLHAEGMSTNRIHQALGRRYDLKRGAIKRMVKQEHDRMATRLHAQADQTAKEALDE